MAGHGTALVNGGFVEFVAAVIKQLPRNIDPTTMEDWVNNQARLKSTLHRALVARKVTLPTDDLFRYG